MTRVRSRKPARRLRERNSETACDGLWVRIVDEWVVHHRTWRYKLCVPEFTFGGPAKAAIAKTRTTTLEFKDGTSQ
eukprot:11736964-Alexandrium_andersonii.AAC.1